MELLFLPHTAIFSNTYEVMKQCRYVALTSKLSMPDTKSSRFFFLSLAFVAWWGPARISGLKKSYCCFLMQIDPKYLLKHWRFSERVKQVYDMTFINTKDHLQVSVSITKRSGMKPHIATLCRCQKNVRHHSFVDLVYKRTLNMWSLQGGSEDEPDEVFMRECIFSGI